MSEKRFVENDDGIYDNREEKQYKITAYEFFDCELDEVVDLLNTQQATITSLQEENEQLRQRNRKLYKCALYGKTIGDER